MKDKTEKYFYAGASAFCVAFGLITCNVPDFVTGFFAGCASIIALSIWQDETANDNGK